MAEDVCCLKTQLKEKEKEIAALKSKLAQLEKVRQTQLKEWMNEWMNGWMDGWMKGDGWH